MENPGNMKRLLFKANSGAKLREGRCYEARLDPAHSKQVDATKLDLTPLAQPTLASVTSGATPVRANPIFSLDSTSGFKSAAHGDSCTRRSADSQSIASLRSHPATLARTCV